MDDEKLEIDIKDLTLGDLEDIEGVVGTDAMRLLLRGGVTPKAMVALVWVAKRQTDPGFSLDDARKVQLSAFVFGDRGGLDPTVAADTSNPSPSSVLPPD